MAVSLRERPIVAGKDAQDFLKREEYNNTNLQKKVETKLISLKNNAKGA